MAEPSFNTVMETGVTRLFHYQRFCEEHLVTTIERGIVRFGSASEFNDPWDCKPAFRAPDDLAERRKLLEWMDRASAKHRPAVGAEERAQRVEVLMRDPDQLTRLLAELDAEMAAQIDKRYRVYCLTTKPDCPLMWAHYADKHRGVCFEFDILNVDVCSAIKVEYRETYPAFRLDDHSDISPLYTKSADWKYEDEYRLIAEEESDALTAGTMRTRDHFYQLPSGTLKSVIVGASVSEADRRALDEIIRRAGTGLQIRQASRAPNRYEILIEPPLDSY
jgi:hypothetical protein